MLYIMTLLADIIPPKTPMETYQTPIIATVLVAGGLFLIGLRLWKKRK